MKKFVIMVISLFSCFVLSGCSLFGSSQKTEQTTGSSTLQAEKSDIINSNYSLKVRKNIDLISGQIIFKGNEMEWSRTYIGDKKSTSNTTQKKTTLTDIKIGTKADTYTVSGKENGEKVVITFKKIGNYRIEDKEGNIYSL
ncbi:hypothetical protein [Enterococcus ratti]|uniref:hypothetical protein n=1 Tax=Enterococcus ratti TaxID=150033 RepID=UPI0009001F47